MWSRFLRSAITSPAADTTAGPTPSFPSSPSFPAVAAHAEAAAGAAVTENAEVEEVDEDPSAYAEWYAWAYRQWDDRLRSHAAAAAGLAAVRTGQDLFTAQHLAAQAAVSSDPTGLAAGTMVRAGEYGEWYWWALDELQLDSAHAHVAAAAAQLAAAAGARPAAAANAARQATAAPEPEAEPAPEPAAALAAECEDGEDAQVPLPFTWRVRSLAVTTAGLVAISCLEAAGHL